jgi:RimJ/RimL family protein N-acetyltransferase
MVQDHAPEIEAPRLTLRGPQDTDAVRLAALANDMAICSMTTRMPYPYALDDARNFIQLARDGDPARDAAFVVELEDEGVVGAVGFHKPDSHQPVELGYWIGRPYWGRGVATAAATAALRWARTDWGRKAVFAGHYTDNDASAQVLIKSGFLYTGEVQKRYSRARGDVAPTRMMVWLA